LIFDGGEDEVNLPNDDRDPAFCDSAAASTLPVPSRNTLAKSEWTASAGLQYQQISIRDGDSEDELGNEKF